MTVTTFELWKRKIVSYANRNYERKEKGLNMGLRNGPESSGRANGYGRSPS